MRPSTANAPSCPTKSRRDDVMPILSRNSCRSCAKDRPPPRLREGLAAYARRGRWRWRRQLRETSLHRDERRLVAPEPAEVALDPSDELRRGANARLLERVRAEPSLQRRWAPSALGLQASEHSRDATRIDARAHDVLHR